MKSKTQRIHEINNLFDESNLPIHLVNDEDGVKAIINNERECTFQFSSWTTPDSMKNIVALANDLYNINPEYVSLIKHLSADRLLTFDRISDTLVLCPSLFLRIRIFHFLLVWFVIRYHLYQKMKILLQKQASYQVLI